MRRLLFLVFLVFQSVLLWAQEDEEGQPKKLTMKGYLKEMASFNWYGDSLLFQNLIHNRLDFAWYGGHDFKVVAEFRNRLITGDLVREIPNYSKLVDSYNDYFDLSANIVNSHSAILNVLADRLYVQWTHGDWEVKAGRQRINWGMNLAWNPNDLFNAYSFFDFDYEERPGSDAVRITHYTGVASSVEVAAKIAKDIDHFVGAAMWKVNKWDYDMQLLGGIAQGDMTLGTGWAGNLSKASFKGELTYFHKAIETQFNSAYQNMFLGAISVDYSFPSSLYLNGSVMYNSQGTLDQTFGLTVIGLRPGTVRDLSPYRWSSFIQSSYRFTPLLYGGLSVIGYPGSDAFFINPSVTISARQNLDLDLIGQMFYGNDAAGNFGSILKAAYVRLKWSF